MPHEIPPKFDICSTCGQRSLVRLDAPQGSPRLGVQACRTCDGVDSWPGVGPSRRVA